MKDLLFIDFTGEERISTLLSRLKKKKRVDGIVAVAGPGRFSAVRSAVLAGNLLSALLRVPAAGIIKKEGESTADLMEKGRKALRGARGMGGITPFYGAEPNITKSKDVLLK